MSGTRHFCPSRVWNHVVPLLLAVGAWTLALTPPVQAQTTIAFGSAIGVPAGLGTVEAGAGDLDGDGETDIVLVQSATPGRVAVLRNLGAGNPPGSFPFSPPILFDCGHGPSALRIADLNGDSKPDLVVGIRNGVAIFENCSTPGSLEENSFAAPVILEINPAADTNAVVFTDVELADFDGDGAVDVLAVATQLVAWRNVGAGHPISADSFVRDWEVVTASSSSYPRVGTGDFDGDGRPDASSIGYLRLLLNCSSPGVIQFTNSLLTPVLSNLEEDVDSDGLPDVLSSGPRFPFPGESPYLSVSRNISTPGLPLLASATRIDVVNDSVLGLRDLDGDGRGDFLFRISTNCLGVTRNPFLPGMVGPPELEAPIEVAVPMPSRYRPTTTGLGAPLAFADLDRDGLPEIIAYSQGSNAVLVLPNVSVIEPEVRLAIPARVQRQLPGTVVDVRIYGFHLPGALERCELFEGTNLLATTSTLPATLPVSLMPTGILTFHAEAVNQLGARFVSPPVTVMVDNLGPSATNAGPTVSIVQPPSWLRYYRPASFDVEVAASDADGLLDEVVLFGVFQSGGSAPATNRLVTWSAGPYRFSVTDAAPDLQQLIARAIDNSGAQKWSAPVTLTVYAKPSLSYASIPTNAIPNARTGFIEQRVTFRNQSSFTLPAVRLLVQELPPAAVLANATGLDDGVPFVQHDFPLAPGAWLTFTLEYLIPPGQEMPASRFKAVFVTPEPPPVFSGEMTQISFWSPELDGRWYLEFPTQAGRSYVTQYSSNLVDWMTSQPVLTSDGLPARWLDQGPPRTASPPKGQAHRFYRVLQLP